MQFSLGVLNNVLHAFLPLKFASFLRYYVCEKTDFFKGLLNQKQKKPFVSLGDEVTEISERPTKFKINIFSE